MSTPPRVSDADITATLEDLKGMWAAAIDLIGALPGAAPFVATRKELPPFVGVIFAQAKTAPALLEAVRGWVHARAYTDREALLRAEWRLNEEFRKAVGLCDLTAKEADLEP